jgi:hypothetical protein
LLAAPHDEAYAGHAERHLALARDLWERDTKIPEQLGALTMYYSGLSEIRRTQNLVRAAAYIAQAAQLSPQVAQQSLADPDIAELDLTNRSPPSPDTVERLKRLPGKSAMELAQAGLAKGIAPEEMTRVLCAFIRQQAQGPGKEPQSSGAR